MYFGYFGCIAIGSFFSPARNNARAVSLRDYKKALVEEEKILFPIQVSSTQYSLHISGNRGYDSNRVRFLLCYHVLIFLSVFTN